MVALKAAACQRLAAGQGELDFGLAKAETGSEPMEIVGSRAGHLWEALCRAYESLGLDGAAGGDEVFRDLVLARIIEPTSKADSLRVLAETGVGTVSYRTLTRHLPRFADTVFRQRVSAACAAHGVYLHPHHNWFLSAAHSEDDIRRTLEVTDEAFATVDRELPA